MKKRKKKRFIRDRLIKSLVIFDIILIIMVLIVFIFRGGPYKVEKCVKMIIIETSFSDFALVCLLIPIFKKEFEKKDSKELVEAFISTEKYIEVIPINVPKRNYFMKHLLKCIITAEKVFATIRKKNSIDSCLRKYMRWLKMECLITTLSEK